MSMEKIVISDTNIFIDLISSNMLTAFFSLPCEVYTTDFVKKEIKLSEQKEALEHYIENGRLKVIEFDFKELLKIVELHDNCNTNASLTDCSVWYAAKKMNCRLLTGDSKLRSVAEKDRVKVSGILYVLDKTIECEIISKADAALKLERLLQTNIRLPRKACEDRIKDWRT